MSSQFRRTALFTMAVAMILTGVGCAQSQLPASNNSVGTGAYDQSDQRKKASNY